MSDNLDIPGNSPRSDFRNVPLGLMTSVFDTFNISQCEDFGRESLGILNTNHVDFGRESIGLFNEDFGRESLGIINLSDLDIGRPSLGFNITDDLLSPHTSLPEVHTPKSIKSLTSIIRKLSGVSSRTVSDAFPSPKSTDLCPQTTFLWQRPSATPNFPLLHPSVSTPNDIFLPPPTPTKDPIKIRVTNENDETIFSEAAHLSWRLAHGCDLSDDMLDTTQEPEDFLSVIPEEEPVKCDTETVFKNVDKLFTSISSTEKNDLNTPCSNNSQSSDKSSESKSKVAIKVIRRLSEILDNATASPTQKTEGQNLLSNLAEMCMTNGYARQRSFSFDISGQFDGSEPLTTPDRSQLYEALDLRKSRTEVSLDRTEPKSDVPLDLSLKSRSGSEKAFESPKTLPPRFNRIHRSVNHSSLSNCSISSNESRNSNGAPKLKSRRPDEMTAKKGPMRAVLPLDTMAKKSGENSKVTRIDSKVSSYKMKKTSTPIKEIELKPRAQSTPENEKTAFPVSPLARPKIPTPKVRTSGAGFSSNKNEVKTSTVLRKSTDDLRKSINKGSKPLVRSQSLVEKSEVLNKFNCNIAGTNGHQVKSLKRPSLIKKVGKENNAK